MKIKKISAFLLAGTLTFAAPAVTYAESTSNMISEAVDILSESGVEDMLSDPSTVVDIIMSVKETIGETDISDDELKSTIDSVASQLGFTLDDSEKDTLVKLYKQFKDTDLDKDQLTSEINQVYDKLEELGITKEDVSGILGKILNFVSGLLN